jgi:hypothetical protein
MQHQAAPRTVPTVPLSPKRLAEVLVASTEEVRQRCGLQLRNGALLRERRSVSVDGHYLAGIYSERADRFRENPIIGIENAVLSFQDHGEDAITFASVEGDDGYSYRIFISIGNGEIVACVGIPPFTYEQAREWLSSHPLEPDLSEFELQAAGLSSGVAVPGMIEVLAKGPIELHRAAAHVLRIHRIGTKSDGTTVDNFEYRLSGWSRDEQIVRPQGLKATDITQDAIIALDALRSGNEYLPLDFSLVGLGQWPGSKWVASFDGHPMVGVRSVYLAHSVEDGRLIVAKTAPRQRWNDDHEGENPRENPEEMRARHLETFAYVLVLFMVDSAYPELQEDELFSYNAGKGLFADSHAKGWKEWEPATWRLGQKTLEARIFRFGDGWTGFSVDDPDRYIAVAAYNVTDTNVRLEEVDGADYDFDFSLPFTLKDLRGQKDTKPHVARLMRSRKRHPDHDAVIAVIHDLAKLRTPDTE